LASLNWHERTALVTGATGIVGSRLTSKLLDEGARVVALVREIDPRSEFVRNSAVMRATVVYGDLENYQLLEQTISTMEIDTVFHLGAQTLVNAAIRSPLATFEANVRGTYHVLEACRVHAGLVRRVVVASSDKAYGPQPELPYREDMRLDGRSPYDVSKSCADLIARAYFETYGVPVCIARCGNVYGEGDLNWSRIVPGTIRSFLRNERPVLRSDGTYLRDYLYVDDVANAYMLLAERGGDAGVMGEAFNFGTERPVSVFEIVDALQELMDCKHLKPVVLDDARPEIREQHLSAAKARAILDWSPQYELAAGLHRTIAWYRACFS
jgi:CDP-glucose 4,6-dehydratase